MRYQNLNDLTMREVEILRLIGTGLSNGEIARRAEISVNTVRSHRKNILNKTGAQNIITVIIGAVEQRLIQISSMVVTD